MDAWIQIPSGPQPARVIVYSRKLSISWCLHFRQIEEVVKGISFYPFQGINLRDFTREERGGKKEKETWKKWPCLHDNEMCAWPNNWGLHCVPLKRTRMCKLSPNHTVLTLYDLEALMGTYNPGAVEMQVLVTVYVTGFSLIYLWLRVTDC